jgi:hypothetical protein
MVPIVERGEKLREVRSKHGSTLLARLDRSPRQRALMSGLAILACLLGGCAFSSQLTPTQPAGVTQQLVMRSLERALGSLDIARFADRPVAVDLYLQSGNEAFVKAFVTAWLEAHRVRVTTTGPELKLRVFVSVLGTDRNEKLIGIPAIQAPILNVPTPEIALFKRVRNRGQAEVSIYAFDGATDKFVERTPTGTGLAKQDDYTILILITFTVSDADKRDH